jgi:hypothetical protein
MAKKIEHKPASHGKDKPLTHGAGGAAHSKSIGHGHKNIVNRHSHHEKLRHN